MATFTMGRFRGNVRWMSSAETRWCYGFCLSWCREGYSQRYFCAKIDCRWWSSYEIEAWDRVRRRRERWRRVGSSVIGLEKTWIGESLRVTNSQRAFLRFCQKLFPFSFTFCNLVYWMYYTAKAQDSLAKTMTSMKTWTLSFLNLQIPHPQSTLLPSPCDSLVFSNVFPRLICLSLYG